MDATVKKELKKGGETKKYGEKEHKRRKAPRRGAMI